MDIKISIRSMGVYFIIPFLINDIMVPFFILLIRIYGSAYNLDQGVYIINQMFTPFLAAFWIYLHMTKYIDAKGNELFYLVQRNKLSDVVKLYLLYMVTNTPFFVWYINMNKKYALEWLHITIVALLFVSSAYFFCYLFKSISLALIPSFIYLIASVTGLNDFLKKISFYETTGMKKTQIFTKYIYFLAIAFIFIMLGNILNKRYEDYNE